MPTAAELFATASRHYETGQLLLAEQAIRQVLAADPRHAGALHLLGSVAYQMGRPQAAVDYFRQALDVEPNNPVYHSSLGAAYQAQGQYEEAVACHQRALQIRPGYGMALNNLGITLIAQGKKEEGIAVLQQALPGNPNDAELLNNLGAALAAIDRYEEAISYYQRALMLKPNFAQAHNNLGNALQARGQTEEAIGCYQRAVQLMPRFAQGHKNLGDALQSRGRLDQAIRAYRQALQIDPNLTEAHANLGNALLSKNGTADAQVCFERALQIRPDDADAVNGLGNAFHAQGKLDESEECYRRACAIKPDFSTPRYNLGVTLQAQGRVAEAQEHYREALRMKPDDQIAHSTYLGSLSYTQSVKPTEMLQEHRRWAERHVPADLQVAGHENTPEPERRLRVGYVSPDFRSHAVAFFLEPILYHHDRSQIEVFCYCDVAAPDWETAYLRTLPNQWREIYGMPDAQLVDLIRKDQIDILLEMAGHTAGNRLLAFARKPSPIQASYLGYPSTTGLPAIDYRIVDAVTDPPGEPNCHSEELVRLDPVFCCYTPPKNAPRPKGPPVKRTDSITFGSLHKLEKLNDDVLELWCRIMNDVAGSRFLIVRNTLGNNVEGRLREQFRKRRIGDERVEFRRIEAVRMQHLRLYDEIDVALDPFPWNGHTTACEALWMGAPVVALRGDRHSARMVASVLSCLGLHELIGETPDDYHRIAVGLARDVNRLDDYRVGLRTRLFESRLCDGETFTRGLEQAYRQMWRAWCSKQTGWVTAS